MTDIFSRPFRSGVEAAYALLQIVEAANPPDNSEEWGDVELPAPNGWTVTIHYDAGDLDYLSAVRSPDGVVYDPWEDPDSETARICMAWRGVGDLARLRANPGS